VNVQVEQTGVQEGLIKAEARLYSQVFIIIRIIRSNIDPGEDLLPPFLLFEEHLLCLFQVFLLLFFFLQTLVILKPFMLFLRIYFV